MKTITKEQLEKILSDHRLWRESAGADGAGADLAGADLAGADLGSERSTWGWSR